MKEFNTTAICIQSKHYMVDISERVKEIEKLIAAGKYFTINRARQYGKTTTLNALDVALSKKYDMISVDFQDMTEADFCNESEFTKGFSQMLCDTRDNMSIPIPDKYYTQLQSLAKREENAKINDIFRIFDSWCKESAKPVVLMIDEVDSATNNQVFLDFLGKLRSNYLKRERNNTYRTFQSVILAGVTDVKHLKSKIRPEEHSKENSPWNIATDFTIDMSLSKDGIKGMLDEYEADHNTGMNTEEIAGLIHDYTNGYPFLVSRICQHIDVNVIKEMSLSEAWTNRGVDKAVRLILSESNTLFQSLTKNLNNYPELKTAIRSILMEGERVEWNIDQKDIVQMQMYGLIRNDHDTVRISNRIFETRLYNLFLSEEELKRNIFTRTGDLERNVFIEDGKLNMRLIMERYIKTYKEVRGPLKDRFKEKDGREDFLMFLKPIINGTGNYYIEAETRDRTRTDVVIDYLGKQYIIELKIWRGERYNAAGEKQISEYLDYFGLTTGYMLSFNFNRKKEQGVKPVHIGDKLLYEGML